jgi:hypothetical protein
MEAITMMRAAMTACLFATACGAVATVDDEPSDNGSELGGAFDGSIAFDHRIDAVIDGAHWWVGTTSPTVSGTYMGARSPTVTVSVGNTISNAVMRPGGWSVDLPEGSIGSTDTLVTATLTDASGAKAETAQAFIYDAQAPMIALQPSIVYDEQSDVIDFSSGEPVHTAGTVTVDLGGEGCPVLRKYAYLMDASVPYGKRTAPNPLAWHFKLDDTRMGTASPMFRVRTTSATVQDWKNIPSPDADGIYTVELTRNGGANAIPQIGTVSGDYDLDILATDWSGNQTTKTWCWDNEPMQPPVEVAPMVKGGLFSLSFPNDTPAAQLIAPGGAVELATQTVTQLTGDPTTFSWSAQATAIQYGKRTFDDYIVEEKAEQFFCLNGTASDPRCATSWSGPAAAGYATVIGALTPKITIAVIDLATNQTIADGTGLTSSATLAVTLPGRAAGAAPHAYKIVVRAAAMSELQPPSLGTAFGDYAFEGLFYVGEPAQAAGVHCSSMVQTQWGPECQQVAYHYRVSALDQVTLGFTLGTSMMQNGWPPSYNAAAWSTGSVVWDSGNDDLPGPY